MKRRLRAFCESAKVSHRSCSGSLQRVVTDFGADVSFLQAADKLVEHYGVPLSETTIRRITEAHAQAIHAATALDKTWPETAGIAVVVAQMDGGMVPIVESDPTQSDRRKGKSLRWKEAKICLAHAQGSATLHYGGTLCGDVAVAGAQWFDCAKRAGFGSTTQLHAVGDGAEWIALQVEQKFGANGRYLIDFYHVCDYLSAASKALCSDQAAVKVWLEQQKVALKTQNAKSVIAALSPHLEPADARELEAPVRQCHRYLSHRCEQLDYQDAIKKKLPIGSGEIESAHRYVVQQRLKRPGAWWSPRHADAMLALRLIRANRKWGSYWAERKTSERFSKMAG